MSARKTPMSTSIPIDLSDADAWDDTELIKEYEESMKNYKVKLLLKYLFIFHNIFTLTLIYYSLECSFSQCNW